MQNGKKQFGKNWVFSAMETKPDYMMSKPKKSKNSKKQKPQDVIEGFETLDEDDVFPE